MMGSVKRVPGIVFSALILVLISFELSQAQQSPAPTPGAAYGAYPDNYREIITAWLDAALVDPNSVQIKWLGEPRPGELTVGKDKKVSGFLVDFSTNSRNVFGAYTGWQKHTALIRDGKVVTATGFVPKIF